MKASLVVFTIAACSVASVFAGPETIIKEPAKELRDQNNVRQGVAPPTQAPMTSIAPTPPALSASLVRFQTDLGTLNIGTPATADQKQKLVTEMALAAQGPHPSRTALAKLAEDVSAA